MTRYSPHIVACLWLILFAMPTIMSCDSSVQNSIVQNELSNSLWLFERADTPDGEVMRPAVADQRASIEFGRRVDDSNAFLVSGYNGCNVFSGQFETADHILQFMNLVQSLRACDETEGRLEGIFSQILIGDARYTLEGDALTIEDPSGNVRVHLVRG